MPPRKVYVNLPDHVANGEEITVTTTKGANKNGTRRANWSVSNARGNIGGVDATLVTASPAVEELPVSVGQRIFKNRVKLPRAGGNKYTVTAQKVHDNAMVGTSRTLPGVELEAWRKVYFTINCMAGLEAWADVLGRELPAMLLPAFIELEQVKPADETTMTSRERVDAAGLRGLVQALPAEPYAGQRPTDPTVSRFWMRLALVRTFLGDEDTSAREVAGDEISVANLARRITKGAPINWLYAAPSSVEALELLLAPAMALNVKPAPAITSKKVEGATSTKFALVIDQNDVVQAATAVQASLRADVVLCLTWADGTEERRGADRIDNAGLHFTWSIASAGVVEKNRWRRAAEDLRAYAVEVTTHHKITFVNGVAAQGTVTINNANDRCTIEVTDPTWVTRIDDFRAGRLADATLKVHGRISKSIAGQSSAGNIAIAVSEMVARTNNHQANAQQLLLRVMLHEIVHALGGVAQTMDDNAHSTHPKFYPETLGGGAKGALAHCFTGCTLTDAATLQNHVDEQKRKTYEPGKPNIYVPSSSTICGMYHRAYIPHMINSSLCSHCLQAFRLRDLSGQLATTY
jgi:hypothetical protein